MKRIFSQEFFFYIGHVWLANMILDVKLLLLVRYLVVYERKVLFLKLKRKGFAKETLLSYNALKINM